MLIKDLPISWRARKSLMENSGFYTVDDLSMANPGEIRMILGIGEKSFSEIMKAIEHYKTNTEEKCLTK